MHPKMNKRVVSREREWRIEWTRRLLFDRRSSADRGLRWRNAEVFLDLQAFECGKCRLCGYPSVLPNAAGHFQDLLQWECQVLRHLGNGLLCHRSMPLRLRVNHCTTATDRAYRR
jgi:hypothetical protein